MHKGPIQSRVECFCGECFQFFYAKRSDTKYCLSCRKIVVARQTKECAQRNREKRNAQSRARQRLQSDEKRESRLKRLREKYKTDEAYRQYRISHQIEWQKLHGGSGVTHEKRQQYRKTYYEKHKSTLNKKTVERRRAQVFCKDACECCGIDDPRVLVVHHKIPLAKGGLTEESNMETLCCNCHALAHWELSQPRDIAES